MSWLGDLPEGVRVAGAFAGAFAVTLAAIPLVRRVAVRTSFYDVPAGYKKHAAPTPYLGGAAVMAGVFAATLVFAGGFDGYAALLACAVALLVVGTIDDRVGLGFAVRLSAQVAAAVVIWAAGLGWEFFGGVADLPLTMFWVVGLINAFNLMDNLDGAAGTVGAVSGAGVGLLALLESQPLLAALAFALAGSCGAFLRFNLTRPARIFLGDGGSMPIGLLVAVAVSALPGRAMGAEDLFALVPIAGLVILDTTLVVLSRLRRGAPVFSGGRDHLTHRLLVKLDSPGAVALVLALSQAALCAAAVVLYQATEPVVAAAAVAYVACGFGLIALLEQSPFARRHPEPAEQTA